MDNVYKKYLLIEDTPPLFVPDDASDVERDWWYQYGQFALQQPGYLGIPNLTLEKYREFDSILVQNFGLHITDIPNQQLQYLILSTIADPNYLNNPNNLPTILQNLGLPQDTPLEQVTDYLTLLTMIMSGVWLIGIGAAAAAGSGYTTLAQILNGTLQVANALDEIDDLISLIQNSEYLIDIISGGSTADEVIQWLKELLQNLIRPNLNNQDINLRPTPTLKKSHPLTTFPSTTSSYSWTTFCKVSKTSRLISMNPVGA